MQGAAEDHATVRCDVLFDAAHPERAAEAQRLRRALQRTGHAFVRGATMLPPELLRRTFELCRRAHALPQRERLRFSREAQAETLQDRSTVGGVPSRLSYQALEEAYEPGTEATAESWNFSRSREWTAGGAEAISPTCLDGLYSRQDQLALGLVCGGTKLSHIASAIRVAVFSNHDKLMSAAAPSLPGTDTLSTTVLGAPYFSVVSTSISRVESHVQPCAWVVTLLGNHAPPVTLADSMPVFPKSPPSTYSFP